MPICVSRCSINTSTILAYKVYTWTYSMRYSIVLVCALRSASPVGMRVWSDHKCLAWATALWYIMAGWTWCRQDWTLWLYSWGPSHSFSPLSISPLSTHSLLSQSHPALSLSLTLVSLSLLSLLSPFSLSFTLLSLSLSLSQAHQVKPYRVEERGFNLVIRQPRASITVHLGP